MTSSELFQAYNSENCEVEFYEFLSVFIVLFIVETQKIWQPTT